MQPTLEQSESREIHGFREVAASSGYTDVDLVTHVEADDGRAAASYAVRECNSK